MNGLQFKLKRRSHDTTTSPSTQQNSHTPSALCSEVVEELRLHYDICETECHQKEEEEHFEGRGRPTGINSDLEWDSDSESEGWESCEDDGSCDEQKEEGFPDDDIKRNISLSEDMVNLSTPRLQRN